MRGFYQRRLYRFAAFHARAGFIGLCTNAGQSPRLERMRLTVVDIAFILDASREQAEQLIEQWRCQPTSDSEQDPRRIAASLHDLCRVLQRFEPGASNPDEYRSSPPGQEIEALGNYGLDLLVELSDIAAGMGMEDCSRELEGLCLPMAAWIARYGGEIQRLAPVVNTLARHANQTTDPGQMRELFNLTSEVFEAVSPHVVESNPNDPSHPWRLLVINRAIVATRTLEPALMEPALKAVVEYLPEDAPRFFEEGMRQMDKIGYPDGVRELMQRYHARFNTTRTLH